KPKIALASLPPIPVCRALNHSLRVISSTFLAIPFPPKCVIIDIYFFLRNSLPRVSFFMPFYALHHVFPTPRLHHCLMIRFCKPHHQTPNIHLLCKSHF